jgi:molybdate transport system substrate-binding protein
MPNPRKIALVIRAAAARSSRRRLLRCLLGGLLAALATGPAPAAEPEAPVRVAVAANFRAPMERIAEEFQRRGGAELSLSFGATGAFYAQIRNGAPFDVLLAADDQVPLRLEQEGLAVPGSRFTYAVGSLALWSARPGFVDAQGEVLRAGRFAHLAVADPKLAPYGAAAFAALRALGLQESLAPLLVQGENIGQTLQFVASGNAELGFVALSQIQRDGRLESGSAWIVPQALYPPIRQDAVILTAGRGRRGPVALVEFLRDPWCRTLMEGYGYRR